MWKAEFLPREVIPVASPGEEALSVKDGAQFRLPRCVPPLAQVLDHLDLDAQPQEPRLGRPLDVDGGDVGPRLRLDDHEAFLLEAQQRLANRRLADSEFLRQGCRGEAFPRTEVQLDDELAQAIVDLRNRG